MNSTVPATRPLGSRRCPFHRLRSFLFPLCALIAAAATKAEAEYTFTVIADSNGPFSNFGAVPSPSLNATGTVAFQAYLDNGNQGIFTGNGAATTTIFTTLPFPNGIIGYPSINDAGTVAFYADQRLSVGETIFAGNGGPLVTIANTAGPFRGFAVGNSTAINTAGTVAFWASQDSRPSGIFTGNGGAATPILLNSASLGAGDFSMNDAGTFAFRSGATRIVTFNAGSVTTIVDNSGTLNYFGATPSLNDSGRVAFVAGIEGIDGHTYGIYSGNGGPLITIADLSGPFSSFSYNSFTSNQPSINDSGSVAFVAGLDVGGYGIFLGDGTVTKQVIGTGDALFGSTVTGFYISPTSLNDSGQVAFAYGLANGTIGIAVANPVPEPSTSLLLALSFGLSLARRRTRKG